MPITLTPEQELRLRAYVERGDFGSIEDAARCLLDERLDERDVEADDDLAWAKPLVDEALAEVEAGKTMSREEHERRNAIRLAALKNQHDHWFKLQDLLLLLVDDLSSSIDQKNLQICREFIEHREFGVALEWLWSVAMENNISVSETQKCSFHHLAELMGMDSKQFEI